MENLKIIEALGKFQAECPLVKKENENPFFHSAYADLATIWCAIKPLLTKNGLVISQPIFGNIVRTTLYHLSGEFLTSEFPIIAKEPNNPQAYGSATTYARRYSLSALLSLQTEEDDDGEKATHAKAGAEDVHTALWNLMTLEERKASVTQYNVASFSKIPKGEIEKELKRRRSLE